MKEIAYTSQALFIIWLAVFCIDIKDHLEFVRVDGRTLTQPSCQQ
ncbi:hypothetical protein RSSM_02241 [Rhodopirellula sallentina SM41]|uniref:Uncharacterized protein n=1 Tax=Rhodopirellula sallentina SM41 TaxID=1263870 RepID=M5UJY0_9BACT|nr:hypothetical protein RSSM_02241 [Rhodopirellula sallentina SM41]